MLTSSYRRKLCHSEFLGARGEGEICVPIALARKYPEPQHKSTSLEPLDPRQYPLMSDSCTFAYTIGQSPPEERLFQG